MQGLLPLVECVPPRNDAFLQREIATVGNLGAAAVSAVNTALVVAEPERIAWAPPPGGVILVVVAADGEATG